MNLKILSMAFLMGMGATALLAQFGPPSPPTPPAPQSCTNPQDSLCVAATQVYNAIIANEAATTTLEENVTSLRNLVANPQNVQNTPGTSLYQAQQLIQPCFALPQNAHVCMNLFNAAHNVLLYIQYSKPKMPSEATMTNLTNTGGNMNKLTSYSPQFYDLFYLLNQVDVAISAVLSAPSAASKIHAPLPPAPAKGAAPAKK